MITAPNAMDDSPIFGLGMSKPSAKLEFFKTRQVNIRRLKQMG